MQEFQQAIKEFISNYGKYAVKKDRALQGYIEDVLESYPMYKNISINLAKEGLLKKIADTSTLGRIELQAYVTQVVNKYGTDRALTQDTVVAWAEALCVEVDTQYASIRQSVSQNHQTVKTKSTTSYVDKSHLNNKEVIGTDNQKISKIFQSFSISVFIVGMIVSLFNIKIEYLIKLLFTTPFFINLIVYAILPTIIAFLFRKFYKFYYYKVVGSILSWILALFSVFIMAFLDGPSSGIFNLPDSILNECALLGFATTFIITQIIINLNKYEEK